MTMTIEKALVVNPGTPGELVSDIPGATVTVTADPAGTLVTETLPSGEQGETVLLPAPAPAPPPEGGP